MRLPETHKVRHYVDVIARWRDDGRIVPLSICWADGRTFQIDRVVGSPIASAQPSAHTRTLRYSVEIAGHTTFLYFEQDADAEAGNAEGRQGLGTRIVHGPYSVGKKAGSAAGARKGADAESSGVHPAGTQPTSRWYVEALPGRRPWRFET